MNGKRTDRIRQNVLPVLAAMIWGTAFVAQSIGAEYVQALTFNAARSVTAFFFLLGLCLIRRRFRGIPENHSRRKLAAAGLSCGTALAVSTWLQQKGLETTSSGKAGFITALYIVLVPAIGIFLGKKTPWTVWISVALAAAGLYCLCIQESFTITTGDFYVLLCAFGFSIQILVIDHFSARVDGVELSCAQCLVMAVLSMTGALLTGESTAPDAFRTALPSILYTGIFSSGVAYTCQILAQKDSNPTVVALLLSLESVFATISGALFLHERMSGREYFGCALMFAAVLLAQIPLPRSGNTPARRGKNPERI